MAAGYDGSGSTLTHADVSGDIISISGVGASREVIETTELSDTTNKTYIGATLYDGSEVNVQLAGAIVSSGTAGAATSGSITLPGGAGSISFTAIGLGCEVDSISAGERVTSTCRLKIVTVS